MPSGCRYEAAVLLGLVAAEQQQVVDAEELKVEKFILDVFYSGTAADDMGLHRDIVPLLDGSGDGHSTRAPANALALKLPVLQLAVHEFGVVRRDVDIGGVELPQLVDIGKQFGRACPL
jgi:hypothetical protein